MYSRNTLALLWREHRIKVKEDDHCHDILHDVFLKTAGKQDLLSWIENPASYVIRMAQNAVLNYNRSQKNKVPSFQAPHINDEEQSAEIHLADCCLLSFIKALPPPYSEALILTELGGLSQKQLAEKLNISYSGAKSRVQRAKKKLKQAILDCCPYKFDKYGNIVSCCK